MKMSRFYEQLFCYLCNFKHQETGFNLVNKKEDIFIDLKTNFLLDNYNAKHNKFRCFRKYKTMNSEAKKFYICLNDRHKTNVEYTHNFGFKIITGMKAWQFFCKHAGINREDLINFLRALVRERI